MMQPELSIVIGSYNQRDVLERVLSSFNAQSTTRPFELIVVDSSSTDGTAEMMAAFKSNFHFVPIVQANKGKAAARNRGVAESKSDIIMITDSDMIAHPDLVELHLAAHEAASEPTCFEGVTMNMTELHWPIDATRLYPYITKDYSDGDALGWYYFLTGNISFPRSVFMAEGGFDDTFESYGWEDLELGYRLSKKKMPLRFLKHALNYHYHVVTRREEIDRCYKKGESAKLFLAKHPELKWFLGLNPFSRFLQPKISESGSFYRKMDSEWLDQIDSWKGKFAFWFLKEHRYLSGILS
jgi:glycosyltransferase involved in cell wall biosynthesis